MCELNCDCEFNVILNSIHDNELYVHRIYNDGLLHSKFTLKDVYKNRNSTCFKKLGNEKHYEWHHHGKMIGLSTPTKIFLKDNDGKLHSDFDINEINPKSKNFSFKEIKKTHHSKKTTIKWCTHGTVMCSIIAKGNKYSLTEYYNYDGKYHRENKPAMELYNAMDIDIAYIHHGKYHRLDGPAIIHGCAIWVDCQDHEYWINGKRYNWLSYCIKTKKFHHPKIGRRVMTRFLKC
jgi:hypothetical protein